MSVIVPTMNTKTTNELEGLAKQIAPFATRVQIDVTDGEFAPATTKLEDITTMPPNWLVDFHMMVNRPSDYVERLIALKPNLVIFHAEAAENILPALEALKKAEIKAGVALLPQSFPNDFASYLSAAEHALIFAGNLGENGGTANLLQAEKVQLIKAIKPSLEIGWDGGANLKNVFTLNRAGIDVINVGAALRKAEDMSGMYEALKTEANREGAI
jgi:ribulose-phosphate 3-epimerase